MRQTSWILGLLLVGCAAPLTHNQPVEIVPRGKWQIAGSAGVSASTGVLDVLDLAKTESQQLLKQRMGCSQPDRSDCARVSSLRDVTRAVYATGIGGLVEPITELSVHYGLFDRLAIGGRLMPGLQRADIDYQLVDGGPDHQGWMALASFSYSHQSTAVPVGPVQSVLEQLGLDDTGRHNFDFALATGRRLGQYGWLTFGGRYLLGRYHIDLRPQVPVFDDVFDDAIVERLPQTDEDSWSHHVGGFVSVLGGYKYIYAGVELSAVYYRARAMVLGRDEKFSGVAVLPSLTVLTRF